MPGRVKIDKASAGHRAGAATPCGNRGMITAKRSVADTLRSTHSGEQAGAAHDDR